MTALFKKLNYWHLGVILLLPIVLALVNPNWIFNVNIVDDYAYLGFQMDYPKYIGWSPAEESYAIERLSALMPGYVVRQIFSPMIANFILHLGVYYVTVFSVYGVLNLLTNSKVALITVLLLGQHPIILRSLGWDYVDGYALAYFILIIFFLTQSVGSARRRLYLIMAGASFILMINANFFNLFYFPAILVHYLFINQWRNIAHTLISPMVWGGVGAIAMYGGLAGLYYALTGNLLFDNSIGTYDLKFYQYFLQNNFSKTPAHWHFLFVMTALIVIGRPLLWRKLTFTDADKPQYKNMRVVLRAVFGLFVFSFGMIGVWQFYGYLFSRVFFYHINIIISAYLVLGVIFAPHINKYTGRQFIYLVAGAFFIPMLPLIIFSFTPQNWIISDYWVLYGGAIICLFIALHPKRTLYALFGFVMFVGMMFQDAYDYTSWFYPPRVNVYVADRYMSQTIYDYTTQITQKISARYDDLSYQTFRMFYNRGGDVHRRLFNSVASVYLWTNDRVLVPGQNPDLVVKALNEADEIVVLSTISQTQPLLDTLFSLIDVTELERHLFPHPLGDIELIFFRINKDN